MPDLDYLKARIQVDENACWIWTGTRGSNGYGRAGSGWAHRVAYELLVGPIPDGLQLDHLCRVRACVNPDHLEPVTQRENIMRGESPTARNVHVTHCPAGHPYEGDNLRITTRGGRKCKACHRIDMRARNAAMRAAEELEFRETVLNVPVAAATDRPFRVGDRIIPIRQKADPRVITDVAEGQYLMTRGVNTGRRTRIAWKQINRYRVAQPVPRLIPGTPRSA